MRRRLFAICAVVCSHVGTVHAQGLPQVFELERLTPPPILRRLPADPITPLADHSTEMPRATVTNISFSSDPASASPNLQPQPSAGDSNLISRDVESERVDFSAIARGEAAVGEADFRNGDARGAIASEAIASEVIASEADALETREPPLPVADRRLPDVPLIQRQIELHFQQAISLGERNAVFSARAEFIQGLHLLCQALDAHQETNEFDRALTDGLTALAEADDFATGDPSRSTTIDLTHLVTSHRTPIYHGLDVRSVTPVEAFQAYQQYATEQLTRGCRHEPLASQALFGIGKLHAALAERDESARSTHDPKAIVFLRAAVEVDAGNHQAANELGVLLARYGKLQEAKAALALAAQRNPSREVWHNLTVVHQRLGEFHYARLAAAQRDAAASQNDEAVVGGQGIRWVTPVEFSRTALQGQPSQPMTEDLRQGNPATPVMPSNGPRQAANSGDWWSRLRGVF